MHGEHHSDERDSEKYRKEAIMLATEPSQQEVDQEGWPH
jgi:hypothetical protein